MKMKPHSAKIYFGLDTVTCMEKDADSMEFARRAIRAGIEEGAFLPEFSEPTGTEQAAVAYDAAGKIIGIATYYRPDDTNFLWLNMLWVVPECRRQTIGSHLVSAVIAAAARAELPINLGVLVTNTDAARLYESLGFVPESVTYRKDPVV